MVYYNPVTLSAAQQCSTRLQGVYPPLRVMDCTMEAVMDFGRAFVRRVLGTDAKQRGYISRRRGKHSSIRSVFGDSLPRRRAQQAARPQYALTRKQKAPQRSIACGHFPLFTCPFSTAYFVFGVLLNVRRQRVQTCIFLLTPSTIRWVLWIFGAKRRFVAFAAWLTLCPNIECFPQMSQVPVPAIAHIPLY